jgi:hypothetical protein
MMRYTHAPTPRATRQLAYEEYDDAAQSTNSIGLRIWDAPDQGRTFAFELVGWARSVWMNRETVERLTRSLCKWLGWTVKEKAA